MAGGVPGMPEMIGEDYLVRRIKALERRVDELGPSLMMGVADAITTSVQIDGAQVDTSNWSLTSGAWVTVATSDITPPSWAKNVIVTASTMVYLVSNNAFAVPSLRLVIEGASSMEVELPVGAGASGNPYFGVLTFGRETTIAGPVTVAAQVYVLNSANWYTGALNRKSSLSATAVFTR